MKQLTLKSFLMRTTLSVGIITASMGLASLPQADDDLGPKNIEDPFIKAWDEIVYDQRPPAVDPSTYGIDPKTGEMVHPKATFMTQRPPNFEGQLDYWDQNSYASNMDVIAFYPQFASPFHSWQNIFDLDGKRYMYVYDRRSLRVFDITDPRENKLLAIKGAEWNGDGPREEVNPFDENDTSGAASIQWSDKLGKLIMVQSNEVSRIGVLHDKQREPDGVEKIREWPFHKGFTVYALNGPHPDDWELLARVNTDYKNPEAPIGVQGGSGSLDVPAWFGGKYMFLSAAPDASFALTKYPDYLHSPGYQAWDMSDPANPKFVSQFAAPGQIVGDKEHEDAYLMNPRAGNRTSWMGSRMPPFIPKPLEDGGKIGFGAMAGLGLYVLDLSKPEDIQIKSKVDFVPKFGGTEVDNIDVSQYERTGMIFTNGYPMNDECYEPYKDIFVIDMNDLDEPEIVGTFPRPTPPEEAPFTDYCQRRGSFGPKRPGYHTQPGGGRDGVVAYAFYNAGVQLFDVEDPTDPKIAGYYVPRFPKPEEVPEYVNGNLTYGVYIEYDRNIIWAFTNHGIYALSSPLLGEPLFESPEKEWPQR